MPAVSPKEMILIGPAPPYRGGIAHFMQATYKGLEARGHIVEIVNFRRQYPDLLFPGKTQYDPDARELSSSVRLLDSINPLSWWRTVKYIRRQKPEVVVFKHWMPFFAPAYGFIARRLRASGIRVLCLVHNVLPHEKRLGDRVLSRYFFDACNGFIVMSAAVADDLKSLGAKGEIHQVGHPVYSDFGDNMNAEEAKRKLALKPEAPALLFFGFVRGYKGLQVLLDSMPEVIKVLPNVRLIVAGECYEDEQSYRAFVSAKGLADHVSLRFEYIPNEDIPVLFSAADVIVQPYKTATQSGVAQIAYHFGRPLIVTDVGGLAEIVPHEKAGLVVPPDNPKALAKAIVRYFSEDLGETLRAGVQEEKEKYSWDRLFEAIELLADID